MSKLTKKALLLYIQYDGPTLIIEKNGFLKLRGALSDKI